MPAEFYYLLLAATAVFARAIGMVGIIIRSTHITTIIILMTGRGGSSLAKRMPGSFKSDSNQQKSSQMKGRKKAPCSGENCCNPNVWHRDKKLLRLGELGRAGQELVGTSTHAQEHSYVPEGARTSQMPNRAVVCFLYSRVKKRSETTRHVQESNSS